MSQENVEGVRSANEALNRAKSFESGSGSRPLLHPADRMARSARNFRVPRSTTGIDGVMRHFAAAQENLEYGLMDLLEILDVGPCVVGVVRVHGRGRSSGVQVERDAVYVYSFRGAKIGESSIFGTRSEALEAVGLSE